MRPQTGEILAIANRPNFDLNKRSITKPEQMKNSAITDMMEPGSTFKIVTAAAALNEHKVGLDSVIYCENGVWSFGGTPLHDSASHGDLSVKDILIKSSNIGAAKLALRVGDQKFYEYIRRFGFGERSGIELPGEINGHVISSIINLVCPQCGGRMSEFQCEGRCRRNWLAEWEWANLATRSSRSRPSADSER